MRRAVISLILLFAVPGTVVAQIDTLTSEKSRPTRGHAARISIAAPADSMSSGYLYWVSGSELIPVMFALREQEGGGFALPGVSRGLWIELAGQSSELKILNAQPHFRVALKPAEVLALRLGVFEINGDKRRARINPDKADFFKDRLPLVVQKVQDGLYDLAPKKPLGAGEYAIGRPDRYQGGALLVLLVWAADFTIQAPASGKEAEGEKK